MFQKTIISKYLKTQNKENLIFKWDLFRTHFQDPQIQENICNSKEEQYQEGFLRDLFVKIFGYTLNPTIGYNLTTEHKNIKDSKKADGAIIIEGNVVGVIELKGTNTTDLGKVEDQAFNYKNSHDDKYCNYVIISNFEKLRFYIGNKNDFEEFNLFELTQEKFDLLYLILAFKNIQNGIPKKLKEESLNQEDIVTKKLYKDYSIFKRELFQNLILLNPGYDPLELFQKSQKLLDRFLFLLFGEDRGLLPPNSVRQILEQWDKLKDLDAYDPLYNRYKKYFGYLNTGYKGKMHDVFAYNGGLFKEDEILDQVKIDDDILYQHTFRLSQYDFASEVDVNILGHIFENSLNEIDEIKAQLEGTEIDKSKTKRKKEGVFYTPKYITKYIVENTVGKLCEEKKTESQIVEEEYYTDKKRQLKTRKYLLAKLVEYRKWLLQITIVDPACGSGAFLNETLNFLINEHQYIDELEAKLANAPIIYSYHHESILEHNLFGVDLNEESVEIAKLSLWLRTAERERRLNNLNNNIKCGNSLINDPEIAGTKAFNWETEFPQVFAKGGFDVVIGNPPYVPIEFISDKDKFYLEKEYKSAFGRINLYPIFYEKGLKILCNDGYLGFITPYTILKNQYYIEARKYILANAKILEIVDFKGTIVFQDAAVDSIILFVRKQMVQNYEFRHISNIKLFENQIYSINEYNIVDVFKNVDFSMQMSINDKFIEKISVETIPIKEIVNFSQGIITGGNKNFLTDIRSVLTEKVVTGSDFNRYRLNKTNNLIIYDISKLHRPRKREIFENAKKILLRQTGAYPICTIDTEKFYSLDTVHNGVLINVNFTIEYILCVLNSKLLRFLYESQINESGKVFAQVKIIYVDPLPIKNIPLESQKPFVEKADQMLSLNKDLQEVSGKFERNLEREFSLQTLSKKLQNWYQLSYYDFLIVLKKQKVELSLPQKAEWENYFMQEKNKALEISNQISATDTEIDKMVYELYGLSEEEILIVENS